MRNISLRSAVLGGTTVAAYAALIVIAYPWLEPLLGPAYRGIQPLVLAWAMVFIFSTARTALMATLMVEEAGYRALSRFSVVTLLCVVPAMLLATRFGAVWLVVALAMAEAIQLALVLGRASVYWKTATHE
jgi:O-antigen/teichoic acid export membrane protein